MTEISFSEAAKCIDIIQKTFSHNMMGDLQTVDDCIILEELFSVEELEIINKIIE